MDARLFSPAPPARLLAMLRLVVGLLLCASLAVASAAGLTITSPAPKETVHDNAGNVNVVLSVEDGAVLPPGYRIRLLLDGEPAAPDNSRTRFQLSGVDRGSHELQALIVDDDGRVLTRSAPVTFYMWQASRRNPRGP